MVVLHSLTPELTIEDLNAYIPVPDFPTAAIFCRKGTRTRYRNRRAKYTCCSAEIETEANGKETIIVHEISLISEQSAFNWKESSRIKLREKKSKEFPALRDESD